MSKQIAIVLVLTCAGLIGSGCGEQTVVGGQAFIRVDSIAGGPFSSLASSPFTVDGQNFASLSGSQVIVRFTAQAPATPFDGGTSATADVVATVISPTQVTGMSPDFFFPGTFFATVTVILPGTFSGTSATPIAEFIGLHVTGFAPGNIFSEIATPFTVAGDGFAPNGQPATVFFEAVAGTPFLGGTTSTVSTVANVDSGTQISGTSPLFGTSVPVPCRIRVRLDTIPGSPEATSVGPLVTIDPPTATSIAPVWVDAEAPTPIVITGTGYGPVAGGVTVSFEAPSGTPFSGGTVSSITVAGTITSPTTVGVTTPISGLSNKLMPNVIVNFLTGARAPAPPGIFTLEVAPDAVDDTYLAFGNIQFVQGVVGGVIDNNDSDPDGDPLSVSSFQNPSANGATVAVAPDGSFTYDPAVGFEGLDTFTYTLTDGRLFDTATVTMDVAGLAWFIDAGVPPGGTGTFADPFDTVAAFNVIQGGLAGTDDLIYVYFAGGFPYDPAGLTLLDGQILHGQGAALTIGSTTIPAIANTILAASAGDAVTLASGNTVRGFDILNTAGNGLVGTGVGSATVDTTNVSVLGGQAVDISNGNLAVTFTNLTSTNAAADDGIELSNCTGTFAVTGATTITNPADDGVGVSTGSLALSFNTLTITTPGDTGIYLIGAGGSFQVTGATVITSPALRHGLDVAGTTGAFDMDFEDLTITTPTQDGIFIQSSNGSFDVNGTCTIDTPGTTAGTPSPDHGVHIVTSDMNVRFADLDINDSTGHGVELDTNTGTFTVEDGLIDNCDDSGLHAMLCTGTITLGTLTGGPTFMESGDGAVANQDSHGVQMVDCTGNVLIENCTFEDMNENGAGLGDDNNGIQVDMVLPGTLASLQIVDCVFNGTEVAALGTTTDHGIRIALDNDATITDLDITGCTCRDLGRGFVEILLDIDDDGDTCDIDDLNISDNPDLEAQGDIIEVRCMGAGEITSFAIDDNVVADGGTGLAKGYAILVDVGQFGLGTSSTATITGTINGNDIDDVGDGSIDRGIELLMQDAGTAIVEIDGNTIDGQAGEAISVRCFDDSTTDVTITSNNLGLTSANDTSGAGDAVGVTTNFEITAITLCIDIDGNDSGSENYVMNRVQGTFDLLGILAALGGGPTWTAGQVDLFLAGQNSGTVASLGGGYTNCTTIQTP